MKYSFLFLLLCIGIIFGLKLLGVINVTPIIIFCVSFGLAMIILFVGFTIFARQKKEDGS